METAQISAKCGTKRNILHIHTTTWINFKKNMLNKISSSKEDMVHDFHEILQWPKLICLIEIRTVVVSSRHSDLQGKGTRKTF